MRSFSLLRRRHLGFLGLLCCGFSLFAQAGEIKGVAVYRERIALTPSALAILSSSRSLAADQMTLKTKSKPW